MIKLTFFLFLFSFFSNLAWAQAPKDNFVHFTEKDGLPSNTILTICQDRYGYLWVGTLNGLVRYDGYNFKNYFQDIQDPNSLQIDVVYSIYEDSEGTLWIGGISRFAKYNRNTDNFTNYNLMEYQNDSTGTVLTVHSFCEDDESNLLLGIGPFDWGNARESIFTFNKKTETIKKYNFKKPVITNNIFSCLKTKKGQIWFAGLSGLIRLNQKSKTVNFYQPGNTEAKNNFLVYSLAEDTTGTIWLGTAQNGLYSFNPTDSTFKKILDETNTGEIQYILFDNNQKLWLATPDGLKFYNPRNGYLYNYVSDINNIFTIKSKDITCLWQDSGNSIWAGSFDTGLNRLDRAGTIFRAFTYDPKYENSFGPGWADDFAEDRDGNIWISCHENFIDKYKKVKNQFEKVIIDKKVRLLAVYNDNDGTMWVSDDKGNIYNRTPDQHSFVKKLNIAADNNYNAVLNIFKDSFGTVWLGTYWYYFSYNETTKKTNYFSFDSLPSSGGSANVRGIFESDRHNLWLCTDDGLFKRNLKTGHVSRVGLSKEKSKAFLDQDINSLYIDQKGILWVGTWRGGLNRYDPATGEVKSYTRQDGLPSNSIQGILGDEEHNALWLSTFIGFSRFDMHSETFQNFDIKDGIQSNLSTDGSALKTSSGDFMFGGSNGFTMFRPDDIKDSKISPRVFLTNFKLSDKKILPGQDSPLKENISDAKQIVLDHDQNDISFDYLGIHFIKPFATQYAYILDHYDENWHNAGSQRTAIYPNLPPGEYTFRVKAANYSNVWSDEASIKVNILYPWWRTNWAYTGYFLLFVMGVFAVDRFQRKRILAKERAASEIKEAKLRAQVAEAENARKTRELEEARQLQLSMLPKQVPQLPHLDIAVYMQTATEVGGDYYDFHVALDGTLTVVIGDATGHGMKAGTMVTTAKSLFRSYAPNPDILLSFREFTRCIKEMNFNKLSMCLTMLKIKDKRLQISSAAMPPAYIYRSNNQTVDEQMFEAMPLGTMDSFPYEMKDTTLQQGDTILLMSDGLPELKNNNGKMYGYKKIREKFAEIAEQTAEDIITFLNDEGAAWINNGSPEDDVTFVVIKLK